MGKSMGILLDSLIGIGMANIFMKYMYWYWLYFWKVLLTTLEWRRHNVAVRLCGSGWRQTR